MNIVKEPILIENVIILGVRTKYRMLIINIMLNTDSMVTVINIIFPNKTWRVAICFEGIGNLWHLSHMNNENLFGITTELHDFMLTRAP